MKHRLLIVAVFLLAGAVVNVAVALLCWLGSDVNFHKRLPGAKTLPMAEALTKAEDLGFAPQSGGFPSLLANGITIQCGFATTLDVFQLNQSETSYAIIRRVQAGWPAHTMRGYEIRWKERGTGVGSTEFRWAFHVEGEQPFPLLPVWSGFVVNTLLYATVLWLLIPGPFSLRRFVRTRRGLCPACAYPRGEAAVCSECGKTLPKRAKVAT